MFIWWWIDVELCLHSWGTFSCRTFVSRKSNNYELYMVGVNGGWSGMTMSWQTEDCGKVLKWAFTHTFTYCCQVSVAITSPVPSFFLAWSCPREVQGQLLNGTEESYESEERVWVCPILPKGRALSWKRRCRITSKREGWRRCLLCLLESRLP